MGREIAKQENAYSWHGVEKIFETVPWALICGLPASLDFGDHLSCVSYCTAVRLSPSADDRILCTAPFSPFLPLCSSSGLFSSYSVKLMVFAHLIGFPT